MALPLTLRAGALPLNIKYTPQQFADTLVARIEIVSGQEFALYTQSSTEPLSDTGLWFDTNTGVLKYYNYTTGNYQPTTILESQLRYTIGFSAPDPATYLLWVRTDATGLPLDIRKYHGGQWVNIYGSVDWSTLTNVPNFAPIGSIYDWPTNVAPNNHLICNGGAVLRAQYSALFSLFGTTFGVGDGSNTFNLPDYRGRTSVGVGQGDATDATAWALSEKKGAEGVTLTTGQIPSHTHSVEVPRGVTSGTGNYVENSVDPDTGVITLTSAPTGGGLPHSSLQPSLAMNKIIRFA